MMQTFVIVTAIHYIHCWSPKS